MRFPLYFTIVCWHAIIHTIEVFFFTISVTSMVANCLDGVMKQTLRIWFSCVILLFSLSGTILAADNTPLVRSLLLPGTEETLAPVPMPKVSTTPFITQLGLDVTATQTAVVERLLSAISNTAYPVTPGDVVLVVYTDGKSPVSVALQVDSSYRIVLPGLGVVDGTGKTFVEFSQAIKALILTYLPFSVPRVSLSGTGSFTVIVRGEVTATSEVPAWGLSRLSSVIWTATPYASSRAVKITGADGVTTTYDLFKALRQGDLSQNPLVRAGDTITLLPAERIVILVGEVFRPGIYQLTSGETLDHLLAMYGGGLLPSAHASEVLVQRQVSGVSNPLVVSRVDASGKSNFVLEHLDEVRVVRLPEKVGAVLVEGAVSNGATQQSSSSLSSTGRLFYQFYPGETIRDLLVALADRFTSVSDLSSAYIQRGNTLIPVNAQALLSGKTDSQAALKLTEGDRFIVPFNQLLVTVAGGVLKPGIYPYIPDKKASYYITMAGGFDTSKNRNRDYTITGKNGEKIDDDAMVLPEYIVTAKMNTFSAMNGQSIANTVTVVGLVASVVSIVLNILYISNNL
jgi:polysaccharide biosynthesis/export protein